MCGARAGEARDDGRINFIHERVVSHMRFWGVGVCWCVGVLVCVCCVACTRVRMSNTRVCGLYVPTKKRTKAMAKGTSFHREGGEGGGVVDWTL